MDKIPFYQNIIVDYLKEHAQFASSEQKGLENQLLIDRENNHFQYVIKGWQGQRLVYIVCLDMDIKDEKIWIWQNNTDAFVADDLIEKGIAKNDIVLAFHAPQERQFTGFATA